MKRLALAAVAAAAALSMLTGVAGASTFTIGSVTPPSGSTANACIETGFFAQSAGPTGTYTLPAGGQITQWQTDTAGDTPGTAISLVALTPEAGLYRVEAVDHETVPTRPVGWRRSRRRHRSWCPRATSWGSAGFRAPTAIGRAEVPL